MRTTLTLDEDVAEKAKDVARRNHVPFKRAINEALRVGLDQIFQKDDAVPYQTVPHAMGLRKGVNLDNMGELLDELEGEDHR